MHWLSTSPYPVGQIRQDDGLLQVAQLLGHTIIQIRQWEELINNYLSMTLGLDKIRSDRSHISCLWVHSSTYTSDKSMHYCKWHKDCSKLIREEFRYVDVNVYEYDTLTRIVKSWIVSIRTRGEAHIVVEEWGTARTSSAVGGCQRTCCACLRAS